jgi:hypothetical protein
VNVRNNFDVTISTDYCTSLRQPFTRLARDPLLTSYRTHCSAHIPTATARQNCVLRHVTPGVINKEMVTDR